MQNTETEWQSQTKDKTTLCNLDVEKATKTRQSGTEMRTMGEKKMEKYFFRCGDLD